MKIQQSHELFSALIAIDVSDVEFFDGATLGRALRSPRPGLATNLLAQGALSDRDDRVLLRLWEAMRGIVPRRHGTTFLFDNIYDVLLWVYVRTPDYEMAPGSHRAKLVFRGQCDASWDLETTAQRRLKTVEDQAKNQTSVERFAGALLAEFPQKLLTTNLEREAVAQHYGFFTSILDFTTDVDVAAYFATRDVVKAPRGTVFFADTTSLLRDGRLRFVKIPEHFTRPNLQKGLFLHLDETDSVLDLHSLFTRLTFDHHSLDLFPALERSVGSIEPVDEIAVLAERVKRGDLARSETPLADRLGPALSVIDDPAHPEVGVYGRRLANLAGIVTDEPMLELRTDILGEIIRTSATGVTRFISAVSASTSRSLFFDEGAPSDFIPFVELAAALATLYAEVWGDTSHFESLRRSVMPQRILLLDSEPGRVAARASRTAFRLHVLLRGHEGDRAAGDVMDVLKIDFERNLPTETQIHEALARVEAMQGTLVVLNLHVLIDAIGDDRARSVLSDLARLSYGVVGTATPTPHGLVLQRYFDLTLSGFIDHPSPQSKEAWTTERWKRVLDSLDEQPSPESPPVADVASIPLTLGRTLVLSMVRRERDGKPKLLLSCDRYREQDDVGNRIEIAPGAVNRILGGPLAETDYELIAVHLLDETKVGSDAASAAREYVRCWRTHPDDRRTELFRLYASLELSHPMAEIAVLALEHAGTGKARQPFETL